MKNRIIVAYIDPDLPFAKEIKEALKWIKLKGILGQVQVKIKFNRPKVEIIEKNNRFTKPLSKYVRMVITNVLSPYHYIEVNENNLEKNLVNYSKTSHVVLVVSGELEEDDFMFDLNLENCSSKEKIIEAVKLVYEDLLLFVHFGLHYFYNNTIEKRRFNDVKKEFCQEKNYIEKDYEYDYVNLSTLARLQNKDAKELWQEFVQWHHKKNYTVDEDKLAKDTIERYLHVDKNPISFKRLKNAIHEAREKYPNEQLFLVRTNHKPQKKATKEKVIKWLRLKNNVWFKGAFRILPYSQMTKIMGSSKNLLIIVSVC